MWPTLIDEGRDWVGIDTGKEVARGPPMLGSSSGGFSYRKGGRGVGCPTPEKMSYEENGARMQREENFIRLMGGKE